MTPSARYSARRSDRAALADLQDHAVQEHDRVDVLQRPLAPLADIVHHRVGHPADQVQADLDPVHLGQVRADVTHRQPAGIERQDLVVEPNEPALALFDDLRLKGPVAVTGSVDLDLAVLGDQRLGRCAIALIGRPARRLAVRLVANVVGQLDLHRPLDQPLGQLGEQPTGPGDLLLGARAGQQLVDHLIADPPIRRHPETPPQPAAASRTINGPVHQPLAQGPKLSPLQGERRRLAWGLAAGARQYRNSRSLK